MIIIVVLIRNCILLRFWCYLVLLLLLLLLLYERIHCLTTIIRERCGNIGVVVVVVILLEYIRKLIDLWLMLSLNIWRLSLQTHRLRRLRILYLLSTIWIIIVHCRYLLIKRITLLFGLLELLLILLLLWITSWLRITESTVIAIIKLIAIIDRLLLLLQRSKQRSRRMH